MHIRVWWVWVAVFWFATMGCAETIRVTSWDLSPERPISSGASSNLDLVKLATELRRLDPDVVLLQHIPDWSTCTRLAQALQPANYAITVCSSFGSEHTGEGSTPVITNRQEMISFYGNQLRQTKAEQGAIEKELEQSRSALGPMGQDFFAQGLTNWSEATPEQANAYAEITKQIETLGEQERDLRHRGYKEAHPLVQSVRSQLRIYSTRRTELERNFPTLKLIMAGTTAPDWALARQLEEIRSLNLRAASLQNVVRNLEGEFSRLVNNPITANQAGVVKERETKDSSLSQVAILAKQSAYFSWSQPWATADNAPCGGYVFSAIETRKQRLGLFSAEIRSTVQMTEAVQELLQEISSIRKWEQNQVEVFLLACCFESSTRESAQDRQRALGFLVRAGFSDALGDLLAGEGGISAARSRLPRENWILVESSGLALNPQVATGSGTDHPPITCDVELDATRVAAGRLARVEAQTSAPMREWKLPPVVPLWTGVALLVAVCFVGVGWALGRRRNWRLRKPGHLLPVSTERALMTPSSYTVIVAPTSMTGSAPDPAALLPVVPTVHVDTPGPGATQSGSWEQRALAAEHRAKQAETVIRQGLLPHLSRWMKEKLLRKLLVDRSQLLAAQEEATRKVMAVDARLSKLELQIQQQTRVYVKRIEELTAELLAAKEENRELIRAKISQVKIEMETARKKLLEQQSKADGA